MNKNNEIKTIKSILNNLEKVLEKDINFESLEGIISDKISNDVIKIGIYINNHFKKCNKRFFFNKGSYDFFISGYKNMIFLAVRNKNKLSELAYGTRIKLYKDREFLSIGILEKINSYKSRLDKIQIIIDKKIYPNKDLNYYLSVNSGLSSYGRDVFKLLYGINNYSFNNFLNRYK